MGAKQGGPCGVSGVWQLAAFLGSRLGAAAVRVGIQPPRGCLEEGLVVTVDGGVGMCRRVMTWSSELGAMPLVSLAWLQVGWLMSDVLLSLLARQEMWEDRPTSPTRRFFVRHLLSSCNYSLGGGSLYLSVSCSMHMCGSD